ncbi:2-polyprenyl-6-methoxyphenol hydroxylase [Streptomyces sp. Amel2xC10]|nr:2-polyprenyl-6-methoxyphenol hydroxylase [Streptomyces sp. Amel2xC10]
MNGTTAHPVIVVGSGPTGLLLAGDLAVAGVPVTLVEKRPHRVSNLSRAFVLHARTLEQLDARGLADGLESAGRTLDRLRLFGRQTIALDTLPSRFNHLLVIPQYEVEKALHLRAEQAGVRFRYESEVTGLTQDADGVTVTVRTAAGTDEELRAAYVVGTDGMRSAVRDAIGLPFPGRSVIRSVVLADVRLAEEPESLLTVDTAGDAFAFLAPFGDGYHRVIAWNRARDVPDSEPLALDEVKEVTRLALGRDYGMYDARWMSRFHSDERQAPAYRVGRVFLAGDAAHVHTPAGGQGMNTGLQDAANLSWKLAQVLHGHARPDLLDTYQSERHPVGRSVLRSSGGIVRLAMAKRPATLALRAALTALLGVAPARRRAVGQITGIGFRYPAPRGAHRLTGTRVPDVALAGGGRLHEALRGGRFVLITPGDRAGAGADRKGPPRRGTLGERPPYGPPRAARRIRRLGGGRGRCEGRRRGPLGARRLTREEHRRLPLRRLRREQHLPQQVGQLSGALGGEGRRQGLGLGGEAGADRTVDQVEPLLGQSHPQSPPVVRIGGAAQQSRPLQFVEPAGHPAGGEHQRCRELTGREGVGLAGPAQGGQDVELAPRQAEMAVRPFRTVTHRPRDPVDPAEDLHGGGVEIGPDLRPLLDDRVDRVLARRLRRLGRLRRLRGAHGVSIRPRPVVRKKVACG